MSNLVTNAHINQHLFEVGVVQEPIRKGYGEGLLTAGERNANVVALCADLMESTFTAPFAKRFPERFVEMGVSEQNMASLASGMAAMGKVPFMTSYATFSPGRNWEQIRTTICYNNSNVKIVGSHAGVSVGPDGGSHQALEDIALTRVLPRMTVVVPCDAIEARKATLALAAQVGPAYLRLAREKTPLITTEETPFEVGKAILMWDDPKPDVLLIACGTLVYQALMAAERLTKDGIGVTVLNSHTVKPLDETLIVAQAERAGRVVTLEEHQCAGGLGGAVAELLAQRHPVPLKIIGVHDQFGQSGEPAELLAHYGLDTGSVVEQVRAFARS